MKKVMIVEDDSDLRTTMEAIVSSLGYAPISCCDGIEALNWLNNNTAIVSIILTNWEMPKMNGEQFIKAFRCLPCYAATPVVVISGSRAYGLEAEIEMLTKPVSFDDMKRLLSRYMGEAAEIKAEHPFAAPVL